MQLLVLLVYDDTATTSAATTAATTTTTTATPNTTQHPPTRWGLRVECLDMKHEDVQVGGQRVGLVVVLINIKYNYQPHPLCGTDTRPPVPHTAARPPRSLTATRSFHLPFTRTNICYRFGVISNFYEENKK